MSELKPQTGMLEGQVAFITGGGSGINLGIAKNMAAAGAKIAICGRTFEKLEKAAEEIREHGVDVFPVAADVRDLEAMEKAFVETKATLGTVSIVVAGAAGNFMSKVEDLSYNGFKTVVDIDLIGSFNTAKAAHEQLKETKGSIIFISAGQSLDGYSHQAHVCAAKAGIDKLMKTLAIEWGPQGIRSNSIIPGPIDGTEGMKRLSSPETLPMLIQSVPARRLGSVNDIGQAAVFLSSNLAGYITGAVLPVCGGQTLGGSGLFNFAADQFHKPAK
ncbi:SDR family oxidoreductase [Kordiimonas laminariae]|uniref:SDR family oxidoreductase n=1 Tax=Kordiimonas laminariae TaxID=2917717 RepID=UPI001FF40F95|nr:SDR family oxidoreductase [Kordiimonas laminariae]MCK0069599.1 SDR family oxidoreductase [Kordiimonas laminariae]